MKIIRRFIRLLHRIAEHLVTQLYRSGRTTAAYRLQSLLFVVTLRRTRSLFMLDLRSVQDCANESCANRKILWESRRHIIPPIRARFCSDEVESVLRKSGDVRLPTVGIYDFKEMRIVGGSELLICKGGMIAYDELARGDPDRYGCKAFGIIVSQGFGKHLPAYDGRKVLLSVSQNNGASLKRGIHLCKDHSANYYHWLLECLPRAIIALREKRYSEYPLLIDAGLPAQNLESLKEIAGGREIIKVKRRESFVVESLVYPDVFSYLHDNYGEQASIDDLVISPIAVKLVRDAYMSTSPVPSKRIFIARAGARYRRLLNEANLHAISQSMGFEIVYPEKFGFLEQVKMFSEAECIVGPTGAGMTNMIFAPHGCKVAVLAGGTAGANFQIFGQLGNMLGHDIRYLCGRAKNRKVLHSDYVVDESSFREMLVEILGAG